MGRKEEGENMGWEKRGKQTGRNRKDEKRAKEKDGWRGEGRKGEVHRRTRRKKSGSS